MTLHTSYRPREFDEVIGQDAIVHSIEAAIKKKTTRCFLLNGPSGVGKTTLARIMATAAGSDPKDIQDVNAAKYTGIDDMRSVTNGLMYHPFGDDAVKTIIVDECHMLSKPAWNSLLEATEEPPAWALWIFCTTEPGKVPETIKTRCAQYGLKPVDTSLIFDLVKHVSAKEKLEAAKSDGVLELCAREAQGSIRQALTNLEVCANTSVRAVAAELLKSAGDAPEVIDLAKLLLSGGSWTQALRILNSIKDMDSESIRQTVRAYLTAVVLNSKTEDSAGKILMILDPFSKPFPPNNGISPVLLAVARIMLS